MAEIARILVAAVCLRLTAFAADGPPCTATVLPDGDVQAAIDRPAPGGGRTHVCLGAGEFHLSRPLAIHRSGVTLRGDGDATVLRLAPGSESPVIVVGDQSARLPGWITANVTIADLRIVGQGAAGSEQDREHPYITNSAVVVRAGRRVGIRGLDVTACRSACILTEAGSRDVSIERNRIGGSVWDGISLNRTAKARIAGNTIHDDTAAGITAEHLEASVIRENQVTGNKTHGIYLSDSSRNVVTRNRFAGNVLSGVFVTCAVRDREPAVQCWPDSMSRGNAFVGNGFVGNRVGFTVAADAAANCTSPGFVANVSRGDVFARQPNEEPDWARYGRCLRYVDPRAE